MVSSRIINDYRGRVCWPCHIPRSLVSICEYVVSNTLRRLSGSSPSGIGPSASQELSLIDVSSDAAVVSGVNSFSEVELVMFKAYRGLLKIHLR